MLLELNAAASSKRCDPAYNVWSAANFLLTQCSVCRRCSVSANLRVSTVKLLILGSEVVMLQHQNDMVNIIKFVYLGRVIMREWVDR